MERCSYLAFLVDTWEESYSFTADINPELSNAGGTSATFAVNTQKIIPNAKHTTGFSVRRITIHCHKYQAHGSRAGTTLRSTTSTVRAC